MNIYTGVGENNWNICQVQRKFIYYGVGPPPALCTASIPLRVESHSFLTSSKAIFSGGEWFLTCCSKTQAPPQLLNDIEIWGLWWPLCVLAHFDGLYTNS